MMLIYFLTSLYILLGSGLLLFNRYRSHLSFLMDLRYSIINYKIVNIIFILIGILLGLGKIFFPISPGPIILGDLSVSIICFLLSIYYFILANDNANLQEFYKIGAKVGYVILVFAILHIIYPSCILL